MSALLKLFETASTPVVSDALEQCGLRGQCRGIFPLSDGWRVFGRAYTVKISPPGATPRPHDEYMDDLQAGDVCIMDAREMPDAAVWGDLRTIVAQKRGVRGTIADGAVRDVSACISLGYPIFTRSRTMLSGGGRAWIEAKQVPVSIGGVYVRPGDLVLGDADGVLIVPQEKEAEVFERAQALDEADRKITAALLEGMPLTKARQAFGAKKYLPSKT